MAQQAASAFIEVLALFGPRLSLPQWQRFVILAVGWTLTTGRHAVTQSLIETGVSGKLHHEAFHRLLSLASWQLDPLGHFLFLSLHRFFNLELRFVLDDTFSPKKGPRIYGIACHLHPQSSQLRLRPPPPAVIATSSSVTAG
jgi:hypothetical protein